MRSASTKVFVFGGMGEFTCGIHGRLRGRRCKWQGVGWWIVRMFLRIHTWSWPWIVGVVSGREGGGREEGGKRSEN